MMGKWQINQARQSTPMCLNESEMNELEMTHVCDKDEYERFTTHTHISIDNSTHKMCVSGSVTMGYYTTLDITLGFGFSSRKHSNVHCIISLVQIHRRLILPHK